jgi:hypothetical protein
LTRLKLDKRTSYVFNEAETIYTYLLRRILAFNENYNISNLQVMVYFHHLYQPSDVGEGYWKGNAATNAIGPVIRGTYIALIHANYFWLYCT